MGVFKVPVEDNDREPRVQAVRGLRGCAIQVFSANENETDGDLSEGFDRRLREIGSARKRRKS